MEAQMWIAILVGCLTVPALIGAMLFGTAVGKSDNSPYAGL
jgi:hypothetical protein